MAAINIPVTEEEVKAIAAVEVEPKPALVMLPWGPQYLLPGLEPVEVEPVEAVQLSLF